MLMVLAHGVQQSVIEKIAEDFPKGYDGEEVDPSPFVKPSRRFARRINEYLTKRHERLALEASKAAWLLKRPRKLRLLALMMLRACLRDENSLLISYFGLYCKNLYSSSSGHMNECFYPFCSNIPTASDGSDGLE